MINEKDWKEFREAGLLWFVNRLLHTFGWVIVFDLDETGEVEKVYPARTRFHGFDPECESRGFRKITRWMKDNAEDLLTEAEE